MIEQKMIRPIGRLGVFAGISAFLIATPVQSADLLGVYAQAQDNDRTFSAARNQYKAIQQTQRQAMGLYYPTLAAAYEHTQTEQEIVRSENEVFGSGQSDFPTDDLTLRLSQPIFRWDFLSERRKAKAEVRQAEYQFVAAEQELMLRTAEAYLLSLAAKDNVFVTSSELDAVGQQLRLAEKRLDVGLASPTEVNESNARFQLNQSEVIEAENIVVDRLEGLRVIVGNDVGELMPLADDITMVPPDPADPDVWIAQAIENNLAVKSREVAVEVAEEEYKLQRAGRYPTLDLVARFNNRDTGGSLFGGGSEVETTDIVVRADWTIFQGGSLRARVKEALYNKQRAEDELQLERNTVRRATRNAYLGVVSSIAKANALKSSLDAQELTVKSKQKGFETGSASNIEVLDAKRDFFFVQRDYLEARYDYLLSLLNLKRQAGQLSPDDLAAINGKLKTASIDSASSYLEAVAIKMPDVVTDASAVVIEQPVLELAKDEFQARSGDVSRIVLVQASTPYNIAHIESHQWLFEQENAYSMQVVSVNTEQEALDYIADSNLPNLHYYKSSSGVKDWYFVLAGVFDSQASAEQAASDYGVDDFWVRRINDLQEGRCAVASDLENAASIVLADLCDRRGLLHNVVEGDGQVSDKKSREMQASL